MRDRSLVIVLILAWSVFGATGAETLPPDEPITLFAGTDASWFVGPDGQPSNWPIEDGALVSTPNGRRSNNLVSRLLFRDARIELEFWQPLETDGNSGVFLHGFYEIQILSPEQDVQPVHGMGAIYDLHAPAKKAGRPAGQWQKLKIEFKAPRWNDQTELAESGAASVWLNGELIHDKVPLGSKGSAYNPYEYDTTDFLRQTLQRQKRTGVGPLMLQDHDCAVRFRNIVVTPLDDTASRLKP